MFLYGWGIVLSFLDSDNHEYISLSQNTLAGEGSQVVPMGAGIKLWFLYCRNETDNMLMGQISHHSCD